METILRQRTRREYAAALRAGMVAAAIYNRTPGNRRHWRAEQFVRDPEAGSRAPTAEEMERLAHRMAPTGSIRT